MNKKTHELLRQAEAHLLREYSAEAVRLTVVRDDVVDESGEVEVRCTITQGSRQTDWSLCFVFRDGRLLTQRWKIQPAN